MSDPSALSSPPFARGPPRRIAHRTLHARRETMATGTAHSGSSTGRAQARHGHVRRQRHRNPGHDIRPRQHRVPRAERRSGQPTTHPGRGAERQPRPRTVLPRGAAGGPPACRAGLSPPSRSARSRAGGRAGSTSIASPERLVRSAVRLRRCCSASSPPAAAGPTREWWHVAFRRIGSAGRQQRLLIETPLAPCACSLGARRANDPPRTIQVVV